MKTDWEHLMRELFVQGLELEEVLTQLRNAGASQYHSVRALSTVRNMELFEADQLVLNSNAWKDTRNNMIEFRKDMTKFYRNPSEGDG